MRSQHGSLKRFAVSCGASDAVAEEVVQETWLVALEGLDRFEERSSLRGWLFGIVKNQARKRAARERRSVPLSALRGEEGGGDPLVDPARFQGEDGCWPHRWSAPPRPWEDPERRLASLETRELLREAIAALPPRHRAVLVLRDVEGIPPGEVCELLEISPENQRVLLHRGRTALRMMLEELDLGGALGAGTGGRDRARGAQAPGLARATGAEDRAVGSRVAGEEALEDERGWQADWLARELAIA